MKPRTLPTMTVNGYTIGYRLLPPETTARLEAAARQALTSSKPRLPTQAVEVAPGEWREVENPHDAAYQEALEDWEQTVRIDAAQRLLTLCEQYALQFEIDTEEVTAFRTVSAVIGDPVEELSDAQVFLWRIVFPTPELQMELFGRLFGALSEEAIQAQKESFRSQLQRAATASRA